MAQVYSIGRVTADLEMEGYTRKDGVPKDKRLKLKLTDYGRFSADCLWRMGAVSYFPHSTINFVELVN